MSQSVTLRGVSMMRPVGPFRPAVLDTSNGVIEARWYEAPKGAPATLFFGDDAGGFDSPAGDLFDVLAERFLAEGASSLRVQYRRPAERVEVGLDGLVSAFLLQRLEVPRLVTVGWGLGAVAALEVARQFPTCGAVALLGARGVAKEGAKGLARPLLLLHGTADAKAPTQNSRDILAQADEPKRIIYYTNAGHDFAEARAEVESELTTWLSRQLGVGAPSA